LTEGNSPGTAKNQKLLRQHQASTWITIPLTRTKKRKFRNIRPQLPEIEAPKAGQTEAVAAEIGGAETPTLTGKTSPKTQPP
jgi:hypothetical protein